MLCNENHQNLFSHASFYKAKDITDCIMNSSDFNRRIKCCLIKGVHYFCIDGEKIAILEDLNNEFFESYPEYKHEGDDQLLRFLSNNNKDVKDNIKEILLNKDGRKIFFKSGNIIEEKYGHYIKSKNCNKFFDFIDDIEYTTKIVYKGENTICYSYLSYLNTFIFRFKDGVLYSLERYSKGFKQGSKKSDKMPIAFKIVFYPSGKVKKNIFVNFVSKNIYTNEQKEYKREYFEDSKEYDEIDIDFPEQFDRFNNFNPPIKILKYGNYIKKC